MKRGRRQKTVWAKTRNKVAAGIVSLTAVMMAAGITYADIDLAGTMRAWFDQKTELAKSSLQQSIQSETDKQKALLKEQLQLRLQSSSEELDAYTEEEKKLRLAAIQQYAATLLENLDVQNHQDREQLQSKLDAIVQSAQAAMDSLADSYEAPNVTFVPTPATKTETTPEAVGTTATEATPETAKPAAPASEPKPEQSTPGTSEASQEATKQPTDEPTQVSPSEPTTQQQPAPDSPPEPTQAQTLAASPELPVAAANEQ
ncbi:hypothetical protein [Paenibacillus xanthanilyticus]|uniref:Serine protease n=1 Tax=Paenibacillus xanthanilyticus TaxID=1783531 RepID=A0ABV8K3T8_9BACL